MYRCLLGLLASFLASGCGSKSGSAALRVAIRTVEDTVELRRGPDATFFKVTAIARNEDSRVLLVELCGMQAQRDIDGTWITVFTPACLSSGVTPLASGDSVVVPVTVFGYTVPNMYPPLDPRMGPGRYRLVFGVGLGDQSLPTGSPLGQVQASRPFLVK